MMDDTTTPAMEQVQTAPGACPHCRHEGTLTVGVNVCGDCGVCVVLRSDGSVTAWFGRIASAYRHLTSAADETEVA